MYVYIYMIHILIYIVHTYNTVRKNLEICGLLKSNGRNGNLGEGTQWNGITTRQGSKLYIDT